MRHFPIKENQKIVALNAAKHEARSRLAEYIQLTHGIELHPNKPIRCITPDHEDRNPSMFITPDGTRLKCFSCGASLDVFDIAAIDRPDLSPHERFMYVYDLLGISIDNTRPRQTPVEAPIFPQTCKSPEKMPDHTVLSARSAARQEYANALPVNFTHPYLMAKRLTRIFGPARQAGDRLLIPRISILTEELISYEAIMPDGTKRQAKGTAPSEAGATAYIIHASEPPIGEAEGDATGVARPLWTPSRRVIVTEGFADAETIAAALTLGNGLPLYRIIASSFGVIKLAAVADALAAQYPDLHIYIAQDADDVGRRAAAAANARILSPPAGAKDFNAAYVAAIAEVGEDTALYLIQRAISEQLYIWEVTE